MTPSSRALQPDSAPGTWTATEDQVIATAYDQGGADACADLLPGRGRNAIQHRACQIGMTRSKTSSDEIWDADENQVLRDRYASAGTACADELPGRSTRAIKQQARRQGLRFGR